MSDPAKSEAIEDVLSSIRRLVSEHHPDPAGGVEAPSRADAEAGTTAEADRAEADAAEVNAAPDGKLVLTPALRVSDPDDPWRPITASTEDPDAHDGDDAAEISGRLAPAEPQGPDGAPEMPVAELTEPEGETAGFAAMAEQSAPADQGDEPETGYDPAPFEPDQGDTDWPDPAGADAALDVAALRQAREDGPAAEDAEPVETPEETTAEIQTGGHDADMPEAGSEPDLTGTALEADAAPQGDGAGAPAEEATRPATMAGLHLAGHAAGASAEEAGDAVAEAAGPPDDDTVDDAAAADLPGDEPAAEVAPPFFSRSSARDRVVNLNAELDGPKGDDGLEDVEDLGDETGLFSFPGDDREMTIDEEVLREIVSEIVREELQGVLGQRITRNVRKMVRREIRMALAAEELE
ncbi:hypothetical protein [Boseongicola sp. H5]|uniref:hypothetical protein n=1 Tax=Boseongicola sp. H5 TaxID=2763261 RepID=UPI001D0A4B71|nr:hypothetical protein [Boseongicola sp. H5]